MSNDAYRVRDRYGVYDWGKRARSPFLVFCGISGRATLRAAYSPEQSALQFLPAGEQPIELLSSFSMGLVRGVKAFVIAGDIGVVQLGLQRVDLPSRRVRALFVNPLWWIPQMKQ